MRTVQLDYSVEKKIRESLSDAWKLGRAEMSYFQSAFLVGLLKEYKPRKILEVGVASGATTAIILQTLSDLSEQDSSYKPVMYSTDLSVDYYLGNGDKKTGFVAEMAKDILQFKNHTLMTGDILPNYLPPIGDDIDFVILDTAHTVPGEILDFLAVLPHLTKNAVVCLHDIALSIQNDIYSDDAFSTTLLYHSVAADKILNFGDTVKSFQGFPDYPNIGAFQINEDTMKYISNVFGMLTVHWGYLPNKSQLERYRQEFLPFYPDELIHIYDNAVELNTLEYAAKSTNTNFSQASAEVLRNMANGRKIAFFGAGNVCQSALWTNWLHIDYIYDNDESRCGSVIGGIPVIKADKKTLLEQNCFIVISCYHTIAIHEQLTSYGLLEGRDFKAITYFIN